MEAASTQAPAAAGQQPPPTPSHHPLRIRTVTAFLNLPRHDPAAWEAELAAAGAFLARARSVLQESLGYEVQTVRVATQPFERFLLPASTSTSTSTSSGGDQQHHQDQLVAAAQQLEQLAAGHGITLLSIGSSSQPEHLQQLPALIAATRATSATFHLPPDADWRLCQGVAAAIMKVAALTDGLGNFRFASSSNMQPGVPFFPVATCSGPQQHRTFALGTESDALLFEAFSAAAAVAAEAETVAAGDGGRGVLETARQQLHKVLLQHFLPLEAAALQIEAAVGGNEGGSFRYLGLDTSLAPGLDTPALTASYNLLLQAATSGQLPAPAALQAAAAGGGPDKLATGPQQQLRFGGPGCLSISSMITQVLKSLPLRLTGYCGLMLAVCEDEGLAAAAADGSVTISRLLQYSAVCGCGLDTVPVPGPTAAAAAAAPGDMQLQQQQHQDAETTAAIAGLVCDVNTLAYRLQKPLACRLLPLPGKQPGQLTDFSTHPYLLNSRVMDLHA